MLTDIIKWLMDSFFNQSTKHVSDSYIYFHNVFILIDSFKKKKVNPPSPHCKATSM